MFPLWTTGAHCQKLSYQSGPFKLVTAGPRRVPASYKSTRRKHSTDAPSNQDTFSRSAQLDIVSSFFAGDQTDIIDDEEMKMRSHVEYVGHFGTTSGRSRPVQRAANDIEEEPQTNRSAVGEGQVVSGYAQ